jgi:hypothetical protein
MTSRSLTIPNLLERCFFRKEEFCGIIGPMSVKLCHSCAKEKNLEEFYKRKASQDGLTSSCKGCCSQSSKNTLKNNRDRAVVVYPEFKICHKCKLEKPGTSFSKARSNKDGLCSACKVCSALRGEAWCKKNASREIIASPERKTCARCQTEKESKVFAPNKRNKDGLDSWCRPCVLVAHRQLKYGASQEWAQKTLGTQGGSCAICGNTPAPEDKSLCVDHDHVTKKLRGLLCDSCNRGIGLLKDSTETLQKAIDYLNKHK